MMNNAVQNFLAALGLTAEEARLYLALVEKGPLTALELSRASGINRTKVYRTLEKLRAQGIVEEVIGEYRRLAKAIDVHMLEGLVKEQEAKTAALRQAFPDIARFLTEQGASHHPDTKVLFYKGNDGIARMVWHTLKTKGELVGYTYRALDEITGPKLAAKWEEEWIKRRLVMKELYSDAYLASMQDRPEELEHPDSFTARYIPSSILDINHQVDIYNDVVAFYNWHEGEVFGVEIYNQKIADLQRQLFMLAWNSPSTEPGSAKFAKSVLV